MNITGSRSDHHFLYGIAAILLLISFGLGDTAIVAWSAALVSVGQLVAWALAFTLTGVAALFTIWYMKP